MRCDLHRARMFIVAPGGHLLFLPLFPFLPGGDLPLIAAATGGTSVSLKHPVARGERDSRGTFDRLAQRASYFSSSPVFFLLCVVMVLAWLGGYLLGASDGYEQATGSALTAMTLLLVALLKNAELRAEHAIQTKLDALATAMLEALRDEGQDADRMLERAIRIDDEV